jgi:phosphate/sulfate permease
MALTEYLWIAVLGGIVGFMYGFLIGANNVANAFASSVSAKSITLRQAVIIASFCEFGGAVLLGASVTSTVRGKLFDTDLYENEPEVLMFGMFTALFSANVWLFVATFYGMPVSTTHDVVGCILGFALASKGFSAIHWDVVVKIFISWFASPLVAGTIAAIFIFFSLVKKFVMRAENPYERAYYTFPLVLTIGIG